MARINVVQKARKANTCCKCGKKIKEGEPYKWVALKTGPRSSLRKNFCQVCKVRMSDTTTSDKLSSFYCVQENLEDNLAAANSVEDILSALGSAADGARYVANEYRDSVQNMPENLQQGSKAQELEEKADSIDAWADELDSVPEDDDLETYRETAEMACGSLDL